MNKRKLLIASSLLSLSAVTVVALAGFKANGFLTFATRQQTNAEYTINTWAYDGWGRDVPVYGYGPDSFSPKSAIVFMFHSTSSGASVLHVREDIKLAVILSQSNEEDILEEVVPDFSSGILSISTASNSNYELGDKNHPDWPAENLMIYDISFIIGDFSFENDTLDEKESPENFNLVSLSVGTTLTYCTPEINQGGSLEARNDHYYDHTFTSKRETIGYYNDVNTQPHIGFKLNSISVTYGCSY